MPENPAAINTVSDTAILVAGCRAVEAERPDLLVRDPFAARLAGDRGIAMFRALPHPEIMTFGIAIRTRFIDDLILNALGSGAITTVASIGSGLDTRPWRLNLPPGLRWIEIDFPAILDYKDNLLAAEKPRCRRERLSADLNDAEQRALIYAAIGPMPALIITEGVLMYLPAQTVRSLASEIPGQSAITHWITDIITASFSQAIGGGGSSLVRHVQADDHLDGGQIIETLLAHGWRIATHRSYIRDVGFAAERIKNMTAGAATPPKPPSFDPAESAGVHYFLRA